MPEHVSLPPFNETGARDVAEVAVAGALGLVPVVGSWLSAGVQKTFAQQEQLRMNIYLRELAEVVNELVDQVEGLTADHLAGNPEFFEAAVRAARSAVATASAEKHRALQNALFNAGLGSSADADLNATFIRYIDELADTHVRLLRLFAQANGDYLQPGQWSDRFENSSKAQTFLGDLINRGLIEEREIFTRLGTGMAIMQTAVQGGHRITKTGEEFVRFVSGPFDSYATESV